MHSNPEPPDQDEDDGTWFQPSADRVKPDTQAPTVRADAIAEAGGQEEGIKPGQTAEAPPGGDGANSTTGRFTSPATDAADPGTGTPFLTAVFHGGTGTDPESGSAFGTGSKDQASWDSAPPPVIGEGETLFGKYQLLELIGEGGMGQVWKVRHVELESVRALKLIKPEIARNAEGWKRFRREARVMDRLGQHPNSVAIYDFKRIQSMAYIEMAFVRGKSLDRILKDQGGRPMPLSWTVSVLRQLCSILQEAHSHTDEATGRHRPIVHRDLKPSNLMLVDNKPEGRNLKVLDFGIAKMNDEKAIEDEKTVELTAPAVFVGTAGYASPEQIRGDKEIDGRSDIYSTGVMLYQFLTGELPFHGPRMTMLAAHIMRAPAPMKDTNPQAEVPPAIEQIVMRCLAKDPDERFQTAAELFEAFVAAAGDLGVAPADSSEPGTQTRKAVAKKSPWPIAAAVLISLGLVGGGAVFLLKSPTRGKPPVVDRDTAQTHSEKFANTSDPGVTKGDSAVTKNPVPERGRSELPPGYAAVGTVLDVDGYPKMLRSPDNVVFEKLNEVAYLPEGYSPESGGFSGWPDVIVRKDSRRNPERFIRISGKEYYRGDPRFIRSEKEKSSADSADSPPEMGADHKKNPCTPHLIKVGAFYIQETEVTNGEIEDFLDGAGQDLKSDFTEWRKWYDLFKGSLIKKSLAKTNQEVQSALNAARSFPAACINRKAAEKYARHVGGRLPTEAEWEFAAKSQINRLYSWDSTGEPLTSEEAARKAHLASGAIPSRWPVKVASHREDQTEQHVFDMTGNVREWCLDVYRPYSEIIKSHGANPERPFLDDPAEVSKVTKGDDTEYVVRGGSFETDLPESTTFYRGALGPNEEMPDLGFRVVISCPRLDLARSDSRTSR